MEQSLSWETNSHSAGQEIACLLLNPKVHYRIHKTPSLVPILNQMNPVHIFPPNFPKIRYNIILSCTPRSCEWSLRFRFSDQNVVWIYLFHACYMSHLSHPHWLDHPNNIWWSV